MENGARAFAAKDDGLSNPYQKHEWIVYHLQKAFGKDNVEFVTTNFGFTLYLSVRKVDPDGKEKRTALFIHGVSCLHRFKLPVETGYGTECQDNAELHKTYDIEQEADKVGRHKFLDMTISGIRKEFEKMEVILCQEAKG